MDKANNSLHSSGFLSYVATLFLGAMNDNLFKMLLICLAMKVMTDEQTNVFVPLCGACFILPYLFFSAMAGFFADKYSKRKVMIMTKLLEIVIMFGGFLLFFNQHLYGLLLMLFLMGTQSTFFGPAKYGFLPETLPDKLLSAGNGVMQLATFIAIIIGGWLGGVLAGKYTDSPCKAALYCVIFAVIGYLTSFGITHTPDGTSQAKFPLNPVGTYWQTFKEATKNNTLFACLLGSSFFWFLAAIIQLLIPFIAKRVLNGNDALIGELQASIGIGIGLGCSMAGYMAKGKIAYKSICPFGLATGLAAIIVGLLGHTVLYVFITIAVLSLLGGCFQLPISTAIQKLSPPEKRGAYIGLENFLDSIGMVLSSVTLWFLTEICQMTTNHVFIVLGILTIFVALLLARKLSHE